MSHTKEQSSQRAVVNRPGKPPKQVRNLGWLLRNWRDVDLFELRSLEGRRGMMIAHLRSGGTYETPWESKSVMLDWLRRPVFIDCPARLDGAQHAITRK